MRRILFFGCALLFATSVYAQTTGGQPSSSGQGTTQGSAKVNSSMPTPVTSMPNVSSSLNLTNEQQTKLNGLNTRLQDRFRADYQGIVSVPDADRAAQQMKLNQQFQSAFNAGAQDILNKEQMSRVQQLQLQAGGFASLQNPDVQTQVKLTADQQAKLNDQIKWQYQQMADINAQATTNATAATQAYKTFQAQSQTRFNEFLTPAQQKTWGQMIGPQFTFTPGFGAPEK
jgi:hypothetical protein